MELVVYYPNFFPKNGNRDQTALRFKRVNTMLDAIIYQEMNNDDTLFNLERGILELDKPNIWNVHHEANMERALEVDFQKFGIAVTEKSGQDITKISTFTFYATVEHLKEKYKK